MRSFVATLACLLTLVPFRASAEEPIFAPGAMLKVEASKGAGGEGPAWHPELGVLSSGNGHIHQLDRTGTSRLFRKGAGTNGLLFDARGRLLACEPILRRVTRTELDGTVTVLTERYEGKRYNQPNDLTVDSHGRIYFTDPRYGSRAGMEIRDDQGRTIEGVYRIDPDSTVTRIIGRELERPNGILVSADDRFLYVADNNNDTVGGARKLYRFDLHKHGMVDLASRKLLYDSGQGRGPDGLKQDQLGRLYVAGGLNKPNPPFEPAADKKGGIYVFSPEGKLLTFLPVPTDEVTNCAFGGDDLKTLYVTAGGTLYSIRTTTPGHVVWPTVAGGGKAGAGSKFIGPWDLALLRQPPKVTLVDKGQTPSSLYYESEPYRGKPTRVFAYLARPEKAQAKLPAMVLVHGGGGTAFKEWAELWAKRGYVALAMDLAGQGPARTRLPDGGPGQDTKAKFEADEVKDFWTYHAVANVIRGVSLLASLPEVDPDRIGVTGISWGGYLTCLVAGLDDRLKVAIPVYGCGFIHENSAWLSIFGKMRAEKRKLWVEHFEPSRYLGQARMPVLFVNGTNDTAYPLDSYQKSYRLVKDRAVCVTVNMPHSHPAGWAPAEIGLFVDQHLRGGQPLARVEAVKRDTNRVEVKYRALVPVAKAALHYTTDTGVWKERKWHTQAAKVEGTTITADLPAARPLVYFLTLTDERKATVSTEHEVVAGPPEGFEALFNGRDLTGWEGSLKDWKVEDGCLMGTTDGTLKYNRFLVWRGGKLKNFELRVQVKVTPGGNSGLNYRSTERPDLGEHVVTGYQCDVVANRADYNGMLYEERGRRILARTGEKVVIDRAGQPWVMGELPLKEFKPGAWHEYRVLVRGNHHQHWIDSHQTVDVIDLDENGRKLEGVLAVQVHVGPAMRIQYRDFFLQRLPDDLPLVTPEQAKIPATARKVVPQGKDKPKKPPKTVETPRVIPIPDALRRDFRLDPHYQKCVITGGFPVVGSARVSDHALREAAFLIDRVLAGRDDLRQALVRGKVRFGVLAATEMTTDMPEYRHLKPPRFWDKRARGLGASPRNPLVSGGEENLLNYRGDPYTGENILIHEFAHALHDVALRAVDKTFDERLTAAFAEALRQGLWKMTYAASNRAEYWAEGVQSWFDCNRRRDTQHNGVATREQLRKYDPRLAELLAEVFAGNDWRYVPPARRPEPEHLAGFDPATAPRFAWPADVLEWNRRHVGDGVLRGPAGGPEIVLTTQARMAGAFTSLTWNGKEFLDSADHGRLLQSAANFDLGRKFIPETFNPTEAGARVDGAGDRSSSYLHRFEARGATLTAITRMAFWLAPGEKTPAGEPAYNDTLLSDHWLARRVRIGWKDLPNVIDYEVTFTMSQREKHTYAQFEALTGYMPVEFGAFWTFDPGSDAVRPLDGGPGEQRHPVIFTTESGQGQRSLKCLRQRYLRFSHPRFRAFFENHVP